MSTIPHSTDSVSPRALASEYYRERIQWSGRQTNVTTGQKIAAWMDEGKNLFLHLSEMSSPPRGLSLMDRPRSMGLKTRVDSEWREKLAFIQALLETSPTSLQACVGCHRERNFLYGNLWGMNARFIKSLMRHELKDPSVLLAIRKELKCPDSFKDEEVRIRALKVLLDPTEIDELSGKTGVDILRAMNRGIAYHFLNDHLESFRPRPLEFCIELCSAVRIEMDTDAPRDLLLEILGYKLLRGGPDADLLVEKMRNQSPDLERELASLVNLQHLEQVLYEEERIRSVKTMLDPALIKRTIDFDQERPIYDPIFREIRIVPLDVFTKCCKSQGSSEAEMLQMVLAACDDLVKDAPSLTAEVHHFTEAGYLLRNILSLLDKTEASPSQVDMIVILTSYISDLAHTKVETSRESPSLTCRDVVEFVSLLRGLSDSLKTANASSLHLPEETFPLLGEIDPLCDRIIENKLGMLFSQKIAGLCRCIKASLDQEMTPDEYRRLRERFLNESNHSLEEIVFQQSDLEFQSLIDAYLVRDTKTPSTLEFYRQKAIEEISRVFERWEDEMSEIQMKQLFTRAGEEIASAESKPVKLGTIIGALLDFSYLRTVQLRLNEVLTQLDGDSENEESRTFKREHVADILATIESLSQDMLEGIETTEGPQLFKAIEYRDSLSDFIRALREEPRHRTAVLAAFDALPEPVRNDWICKGIWIAKGRPNQWGFGERELRRDPFQLLGFLNEKGQCLIEQVIEKEIHAVFVKFANNLAQKTAQLQEKIDRLSSYSAPEFESIRRDPQFERDLERLHLNPAVHDPYAIAFQIATSRIDMPLKEFMQVYGKDMKARGVEDLDELPTFQGLKRTLLALKRLILKINLRR